MRSGMATLGRNSRRTMPQNEATARPYAHPSPYYGWNARGNLANMDPREAIQLDNIFPGVQTVELRKGCVNWKTAAPATVRSLMPYSGLTIDKLFAATSTNIYDVTTAGAFGAAAVACTNGYWQSLNMATAGGNFLFAVNGTDSAKTFDGAAWAIPVITVATSSTWSYCCVHKKRIWAIQKNTMMLWYLPVDSITGAATQFPVGSLFTKGGYVKAVTSWTIDNGAGADDLFAICTSNGEIAVYQGTDPASSTTWSLVGVYDVAIPVSTTPFLKYGGDVLYLSKAGLIPLSKLMQSATLDRSVAISYNIDGAFLDAAVNYSTVIGWQMLTRKASNLLIVNVPVSQDTLSYQFVMNTITKKWCRFTGWNASCWAEFQGEIYFAGGALVSKAWAGITDAGAPIVGTAVQSYAALGSKAQKDVTLVKPYIGLSGSAQISLALDADFRTFNGQTIFTYAPGITGAIWDTSLWDTGLWDGGASLFDPKWLTVPGDLGSLHSFRLQITTSSGSFTWTSTDFVTRLAGIL